MQFDPFFILYSLVCLCLGSAVTAISWRWHERAKFMWQQEAIDYLSIPNDTLDTPKPPSFIHGRSKCTKCNTPLEARDLIPVISYITCKGRCRHCQHPISLRYPVIELLTLISLLPLYFLYLEPLVWVVSIVLLSSLLVSLTIDFEHQWLPDELNALVAVLAFVLLYRSGENTNAHIIAGLIGYALVIGLRFLFLVIRKVEAIGLGDAKLLAALTFWLGPQALSPILLIASVTGILFCLITNKTLGSRIAFGPFLIVASFTLFYSRAFT